MKKTTAALAALVSATAAFAATPVAVWHGDFEARFSGCTLNLNGNALSADKSTITIDQTYAGVDINFATPVAGASGITVLVEYSGLANGGNAKALATSCVTSAYNADRTGVDLQADNRLRGMWHNGTNWNDFNPYDGTIATEGYMAFTYKAGGGTYLHTSESAGNFPANATWGSSALHSGSDNSIYGATIGGMRSGTINTNWRAALGMQITGIAVFGSVLTVDELNTYSFPSYKVVKAGENASFSALSTEIGDVDTAYVHVPAGSSVAVDGPFAATKVYIISDGSITLTASSKPDASYFSNVDFAGVAGGVLRSWLTPGVIGFNFNANGGRSSQGSEGAAADTTGALVGNGTWMSNNYESSGTADLFGDGLSTFTWSSANCWSEYDTLANGTFMQGYLDDGGNTVNISLTNVPFEQYDLIIYCSTDNKSAKFKAKTVNGVAYKYDVSAGETVVASSATDTWGMATLQGTGKAVAGVNALRINGLSGALSINGGSNGNGARGCISAVQIMSAGTGRTAKYTLDLGGGTVRWSEASWRADGEAADAAPLDGSVELRVATSTSLVVDSAASLGSLKIVGSENAVLTVSKSGDGASFFAGCVLTTGGVLQLGADDVFAGTPTFLVYDGGTLDMNGHTIDASAEVTISGAGSGDWPWAITSSGGESGSILAVSLAGDATVGGTQKIKFGTTGAAYQLYLNGHTLTKTGAGELYCTNVRTNNGGTLDISEGTASFNQWTSLDGSETIDRHTTVIVREGAELRNNTGRRLWIDTLEVRGGKVYTTAQGRFGISTRFTGACDTTCLEFNSGATAELAPTAAGIDASGWTLPSDVTITVYTHGIDASKLQVGSSFTLLSAPAESSLEGLVVDESSSRFELAVTGNTITAEVVALANFIHYDFNSANSIAEDSTYGIGNINPESVPGRDGNAGLFKDGTTPWFSNNTAGKSPFHAGEMTVVSVIKPLEAGNMLLWNLGDAFADGIALVAKDSETLSLVAWTGGGTGYDVAQVSGIDSLVGSWHIVSVVATPTGTTLKVDDLDEAFGASLPSGIGQVGQFGSIYNSKKSYSSVGDNGYWLDDWRVYDAALDWREIKEIKRQLLPSAFRLYLR